jgi:hypothetical protein
LTRTRALVAGAVVLVVLAVVLGIAARNGPPPRFTVTKVHGAPLLDGATSGPGTALDGGLRVPPGAGLLGTTIPIEYAVVYQGRPIPDRGFTASMFVTGDPIVAMRALAAQAHAAGLVVGGVHCPRTREAWFLSCGLGAHRESANRVRWMTASLVRGNTRMLDQPLSHLVVEYHDHERLPDFPTFADVRSPDVGGGQLPPLSNAWPALPGPGDELALAPARPRQLRVEPGTHVVAPFSAGCAATYNAVLAVEGDPMQVMRAYSQETCVAS